MVFKWLESVIILKLRVCFMVFYQFFEKLQDGGDESFLFFRLFGVIIGVVVLLSQEDRLGFKFSYLVFG